MFVQNHMTPDPVVALTDTFLAEAFKSMQEGGFHQLPVVDSSGVLLGIVTDRDIRSAIGYDESKKLELHVEEIMTPDPVTVRQDATLEEAVRILYRDRFGALPVVDHQALVGIITRHDILKAFNELLGLDRGGSRIEIAIPNGAADIAAAMQAIDKEVELFSVVAARLRQDGSEPILYIRAGLNNPLQLEKQLRASGAILLAPETAPKSM